MARRSKRSRAAIKGWKTRRANARRRAAKKGWKTRRANARRRAAKKGWETRRARKADPTAVLANLVDLTSRFGDVSLQEHDTDFLHGRFWDRFTVGIEESISLDYAATIFSLWGQRLASMRYKGPTVIRGRLSFSEDSDDGRRHWYTLASVEEFKNAWYQVGKELRSWSSRIQGSGSADGIDGFEVEVALT